MQASYYIAFDVDVSTEFSFALKPMAVFVRFRSHYKLILENKIVP